MQNKKLSDKLLWVLIAFAVAIILVLITQSLIGNGAFTNPPDAKYFTDQDFGFELSVPDGVEVSKQMNEGRNRFVLYESNDLKFEVKLRDKAGTEFENYIYLDFPLDSEGTLGNKKARIFKAPDGYCDGPSCGSPFIAYVAEEGGDFYHLVFYGDTELTNQEKQILESFQFTN